MQPKRAAGFLTLAHLRRLVRKATNGKSKAKKTPVNQTGVTCNLTRYAMQIINQNTVTMSSLEIAELTGKEHKNVLRDIRFMLAELQKDGSDLSHVLWPADAWMHAYGIDLCTLFQSCEVAA